MFAHHSKVAFGALRDENKFESIYPLKPPVFGLRSHFAPKAERLFNMPHPFQIRATSFNAQKEARAIYLNEDLARK